MKQRSRGEIFVVVGITFGLLSVLSMITGFPSGQPAGAAGTLTGGVVIVAIGLILRRNERR